MELSVIYRVYPSDTQQLRLTLKAAGLSVKRCKLGGNRVYILVHTSDNREAIKIIEPLGYELNRIYETDNDHIFQTK